MEKSEQNLLFNFWAWQPCAISNKSTFYCLLLLAYVDLVKYFIFTFYFFFRFPSPVLRVQFHPREEREILVSPMRHAAVVVYLPENPSTTTTTTTTTLNTQGAEHKLVPLDDEVITGLNYALESKVT